MEVTAQHLHNAHNVSPFECLKCSTVFEKLENATEHCAETSTNLTTCTSLDIRVNFGPVYNNSIKTNKGSSIASSTSCSSSSEENREEDNLKFSKNETTNFNYSIENCCSDCPFKCLSLEKFKLHRSGHNPTKSIIFLNIYKIFFSDIRNYKCLFCNWGAKKKSLIQRHMHYHTTNPEKLMTQVEQNFVKNQLSKTLPLTLQLSSPSFINNSPLNKMSDSAFTSAKFPYFTPKMNNQSTNVTQMIHEKASITPQKPPILPPYNPNQMASILTMLYSINPALASIRTSMFVEPKFSFSTNQANICSNSILEQVINF